MLEGSESWFNVNLLHLNATKIEEIVFTLDVLYIKITNRLSFWG